MTLNNEQANKNWPIMYDSALAGQEVIIERQGKPMVAVLNYEQLQTMKQRLVELELLILHKKRSAEMDADPTKIVTQPELERRLAQIDVEN